MPVHFSPAALKFLTALGRHNDRAWFEPRKSLYEQELKLPMLALIDEVNAELASFAPAHVRPASKIMMRLYRDTRFSADKRPYKTRVAAWWARQGLEKTSGAGFYFSFGPEGVHIAAGCYMPQKDQLLSIRRMLLERHAEYRAIMRGRSLRALLQPIDGKPLTRIPKGFPANHLAHDLVLQRQWGVSSDLSTDRALDPGLLYDLTRRFRTAAPLVSLLNSSLGMPAAHARKPLF